MLLFLLLPQVALLFFLMLELRLRNGLSDDVDKLTDKCTRGQLF